LKRNWSPPIRWVRLHCEIGSRRYAGRQVCHIRDVGNGVAAHENHPLARHSRYSILSAHIAFGCTTNLRRHLMNRRFWIGAGWAGLMVCALAATVAAVQVSSQAPDLREHTLDLNLGDAGGHSTVLYNQATVASSLDTNLARQNVAGMKEALASGLEQLQKLEQAAAAGADQKRIKIYQNVRREYDAAAKAIQDLDAALADAKVDNQRVTDLTQSVIKNVARARKELTKAMPKALKHPPSD
jgi:hypothetical protein